jgi:hypothetical protein
LPGDPERLTHRTLVEVVHELGHVASLVHCPDAACIMSFAGSVERVDVRGGDFCPACAAQLPPWLVRPIRRRAPHKHNSALDARGMAGPAATSLPGLAVSCLLVLLRARPARRSSRVGVRPAGRRVPGRARPLRARRERPAARRTALC